MQILINNLDMAFRVLQPEQLYRNIIGESIGEYSSKRIPKALFSSFAGRRYGMLSPYEKNSVHNLLEQSMDGKTANRIEGTSVFNLLLDACDKFLKFSGDTVVCQSEKVLFWQQCFLSLGQDLFTTAGYAANDLFRGITRKEFLWPPVIRTDDDMLCQMLKRGIAENHSHLGGTSQPFVVMWAYLMNYPQKCRLVDKKIKRNLQAVERRSAEDEMWAWSKRLSMAAWIRMTLYKKLHGEDADQAVIGYFQHLDADNVLYEKVDCLRQQYGLRVDMPNGKQAILDYALDIWQPETANHVNRLLAGERSFMYQCFRNIFDGTWTERECNGFYLYLLIKTNFRSEIVQVNGEYGFDNFKEYQDRKSLFYEYDQVYDAEMTRLAINGNMDDYSIRLFETRCAPASTSRKIEKKIRHFDLCASSPSRPSSPFFYVIHFIKGHDKLKKGFAGSLLPRNYKERKRAYTGAKALYEMVCRRKFMRYRVLGIDAASSEFGCRPEVFAQAFRGLKKYNIDSNDHAGNGFNDIDELPFDMPTEHGGNTLDFNSTGAIVRTLGVTFHAGEDFYDMADGLRAIDEALLFLQMGRGARIAHALALGVEPEVHYRLKQMRSVLPKQDYLDNLVWLLYRSRELGIEIPALLEKHMQDTAVHLMNEIYRYDFCAHGKKHIDTHMLYRAWQLRGDPPEWYETYTCKRLSPSDFGNEAIDESLNNIRNDEDTAFLYGCYHYSTTVRENGAVSVEVQISSEYVNLIRRVQDAMMRELGNKGISIECNPTSNYLIGTFRDYGKHPIFRFYPIRESETTRRWIRASINTDDLGVFDTSLENEYMIMAAALREKRADNGERLYADDEIEAYLNRIREIGIQQSFWNQIK